MREIKNSIKRAFKSAFVNTTQLSVANCRVKTCDAMLMTTTKASNLPIKDLIEIQKRIRGKNDMKHNSR